MRVLIVGGGGREHALGWKIAQDGGSTIYSAPGNAGLAELGPTVDIPPERIGELADFARENAIDCTVVGPEIPLIEGIVDEFLARGIRVFGPRRAAARIEGSKIFAKNLMRRHKIPTADFDVFDDAQDAHRYIDKKGAPIVVKADGAAAGKGVIVAEDTATAHEAVAMMMEEKALGAAGLRVVIEERLIGQEMSLLFFTDGEEVSPLAPARDYKRVGDGDTGPNTGGMGCYSPVPFLNGDLMTDVLERITRPTIQALRLEGIRYRGVLYVGIILTNRGLKILEYNARFGDPETQVQMPRLETPLIEILEACSSGRLREVDIRWRDNAAACVVMAAGGYPGRYERGKVITGLRDAAEVDEAVVFHAGTKLDCGNVVTNGGRVLGVTAAGPDLPEARQRAYRAVSRIAFGGAFWRKDVALGITV